MQNPNELIETNLDYYFLKGRIALNADTAKSNVRGIISIQCKNKEKKSRKMTRLKSNYIFVTRNKDEIGQCLNGDVYLK